MHAVRNVRLCTKDCLCLYVCPTGATDTETGQIDAEKCLDGCRACVDACPSHAISLVPESYPPQQEKANAVKNSLLSIAENKAKQEKIARYTVENTTNPVLKQLASAFEKSNRLMTEDLIREAGFMLPQSENVSRILNELLKSEKSEDFPRESVKKLIALLDQGNSVKENMSKKNNIEKYRCSVCGYIHEGPLPDDFKCPICKQSASAFDKVDE